jgi:hypothetical protein
MLFVFVPLGCFAPFHAEIVVLQAQFRDQATGLTAAPAIL